MLKDDQPTNKHLSFHELIESEEAGQLSISFLRQKSCTLTKSSAENSINLQRTAKQNWSIKKIYFQQQKNLHTNDWKSKTQLLL